MGDNADEIRRRLAQTWNETNREHVDERVEQARSVVGETIGTVNKTLGETLETVKQTFETTRERVAATVAQTAEYLPDRETIADNAQALAGTLGANAQQLAESAQAIAGTLGTNGQRLAENAQALAGTLGTNAQHLADNAQTVAGSVGTNAQAIAGNVGTNAKRAYAIVRENPLGLLIGGLAVGFLVGLVVPISDVERQKIGPIRDDLVQKSTAAAQDAIVQGLAGTNVASSPAGTTSAPSI
jgi:uncharacterized protein YoxC